MSFLTDGGGFLMGKEGKRAMRGKISILKIVFG